MGMIEEVGAHLAASSTRFVAGTTLFYHSLPESTSDAKPTCGLFEAFGLGPVRTMNGSNLPPIERPAVRVICRSTAAETADVPSPVNARVLAQKAWHILERTVDTTLSGTTYLRIEPAHSPYAIGRDEIGRHLFQFTAYIERKPSTSN